MKNLLDNLNKKWDEILDNFFLFQLATVSDSIRFLLKSGNINVKLINNEEKIILLSRKIEIPGFEYNFKSFMESIIDASKQLKKDFYESILINNEIKTCKVISVKYFDVNGEEFDPDEEDEIDRVWNDEKNDYDPPYKTLAKKIVNQEVTVEKIDIYKIDEMRIEKECFGLKDFASTFHCYKLSDVMTFKSLDDLKPTKEQLEALEKQQKNEVQKIFGVE